MLNSVKWPFCVAKGHLTEFSTGALGEAASATLAEAAAAAVDAVEARDWRGKFQLAGGKEL